MYRDINFDSDGLISGGEKIQLTEDACELCFQSNYLSHFLLTALLTGESIMTEMRRGYNFFVFGIFYFLE